MKNTTGIIQALAAFILWSTLAIFFNRTTLPIGIYISMGSLAALCLIYLYSLWLHAPINPHLNWPIVGIFLAAAFKGIFWFKALQIYPVAQAMIIHNLAPVFAMLFAPLLIKEKPKTHHFLAAITGLLGLTLVLNLPGQATFVFSLGAFLSLGSAAASGFQDVCHRKAKSPALDQSFIFILGQALGGTLALLFGTPTALVWQDFQYIIYFGLAGTLIPMLLLVKSFRSLKSFEVALLGYTEPILGALWASLFLNQPLTPTTILGAALIFLSGLSAIRD